MSRILSSISSRCFTIHLSVNSSISLPAHNAHTANVGSIHQLSTSDFGQCTLLLCVDKRLVLLYCT
ncbi:hypothetical protein BC937DRAFT_93460 [Endogone sp. FLAS-F59071]|nr:hypothetical protein BC937DRAFT_93460 [Endogone sp. FLAS-F59071]|eukprot:RUS14701.1 hypothetical protein BC937DRAFT_93460 [Endogone sp. FLAS-F59071]